MNSIHSIIDFSKHPIDDIKYLNNCNSLIKKNSLLVLEDFLSKKSLDNILTEAKKLESKAFYCEQQHTILLSKQSDSIDKSDPLNILMTSDKGCVPHDLLSKSSDLNILYNSDIFKSFIRKVLNLDKIFPYADNLSSINLNYYQKGQQLGWHFDNASFAITLMIQSSTLGGEFEYITEGRVSHINHIDKKLISNVIEGKSEPNLLNVSEGTLILFYGRNYLHRVTPVQSDTPRILITLNYNEENNIELSENARLTFFGRTN
ncbi:2OG-Fe(II) oxygenase [Alphaproteobacteria bacterium]|nr:2OG-Fe(II) oxygenase [Alphaproteobacteria bacterium]